MAPKVGEFRYQTQIQEEKPEVEVVRHQVLKEVRIIRVLMYVYLLVTPLLLYITIASRGALEVSLAVGLVCGLPSLWIILLWWRPLWVFDLPDVVVDVLGLVESHQETYVSYIRVNE